MGLSRRTNKARQVATNKASQDATGNGVSIEEPGFLFQSRVSVIIGAVAVVGAALFLVFFFTSDIPGKIAAAKTQVVYAAQGGGGNDTSDVVDGEDSDSDTATTSETPLLPSMTVSKAEMVAFLDKMSESEFQAFVDALVNVSAGDKDIAGTIPSKESDGKTLEDAYAEAEELYPGQIDGSRRLKLVADMNATDYLYYVVEKGDTMNYLSDSFKTSLGQLIEMNGIQNANKIYAGEVLLFPSETVQPDIAN